METFRRYRPVPTDEYLANPHKGCCTFQYFNGDPVFYDVAVSDDGTLDFPELAPAAPPGPRIYTLCGHPRPVTKGYMHCTVAYCRWHWSFMEPNPGEYNFSMIDQAFKRCAERGQTMALRLMAFGDAGQPQLPDWYVQRYATVQQKRDEGMLAAPIHDSPEYFERFGGFLTEFARRYADNPLLETIDMAYIGPWGEGAGDCTPKTCQRFVDLFKKLFPKVPRLALIEGDQLRLGINSGSGWRCDSFGNINDAGNSSVLKINTWNHMYDLYPSLLLNAGATDNWKTAPIHLEVGIVPMCWHERNYDVDFILQQGLKYHATYFMPKHTELPSALMEKLQTFCRKLGYRFVLRQALMNTFTVNRKFQMQFWIENVGVAPIYHSYDLALRLRQDDHETIMTFDGVDIRKWLPGDVCIDRNFDVPAGFRAGNAELAVGLIDPMTQKACVSFANREVFSDRWLSLGGIEIV